MTNPRRLARPPIREALIELQVKPPRPVDMATLEAIYDHVRVDYPEKQAGLRRQLEFTFTEGLPKGTEGTQESIGFRFLSEDGTRLFHTMVDRFSFNRIGAYDSWESTRDEARRLWGIYADAVRPEAITRVAVRYINDLEFPMSNPEPAAFLTTPPPIPRDVPDQIGAFLTRVLLRDPATGAEALVTQIMEGGIEPDKWTVTLDIDVFTVEDLRADEESAWNILEQLRKIKNDIFFGTLTDKALELFK